MKIVSWNVNGLRSIGDLEKHLSKLDADISCFQETKISRCQLGNVCLVRLSAAWFLQIFKISLYNILGQKVFYFL